MIAMARPNGTPEATMPAPAPAPEPTAPPTPASPVALTTIKLATAAAILWILSIPATFRPPGRGTLASLVLLALAWAALVGAAVTAPRAWRVATVPVALLSCTTIVGFPFAGPFGVLFLLAALGVVWAALVLVPLLAIRRFSRPRLPLPQATPLPTFARSGILPRHRGRAGL